MEIIWNIVFYRRKDPMLESQLKSSDLIVGKWDQSQMFLKAP